MMRSMFSVISGLKNHQLKMDVIGNNIANVNTYGYKKSRVIFKDTLYQTMKTGAAPTDSRGGTNATSIGLGMVVGSVDTICTAGSSQTTGKNTDLCINGNGYFVVESGGEFFYTRNGAFDFDKAGNLYAAGNGALVMGWVADPDNDWTINSDDKNNPVGINIGDLTNIEAQASTSMTFTGNLDSATELTDAAAGSITPIITSKEVYDSLGESHTVTFQFTKVSADAGESEWEYAISYNDFDFADTEDITGTMTFDSSGQLTDPVDPVTLDIPLTNGAEDLSIDIDFSDITQYKGTSTAWAEYCDGYTAGELKSVSIGQTGVVVGTYSNEITRDLAQIALASFQNPAGLTSIGESLYQMSSNSGDPKIGIPGDEDKGVLIPGSLEMSNVDLSEEFVEMITTQRGFQANSRVITTSDEMLQELVNLKR